MVVLMPLQDCTKKRGRRNRSSSPLIAREPSCQKKRLIRRISFRERAIRKAVTVSIRWYRLSNRRHRISLQVASRYSRASITSLAGTALQYSLPINLIVCRCHLFSIKRIPLYKMRPRNLYTSPWLELKVWGPLQKIMQTKYVLWKEVSLGYLIRLGINQSLSRNLKFELQLMNLTIRLSLALWLSFITLTGGSLPLPCIKINRATPNPRGRTRHHKIMQIKEPSELKSPYRMREAWPKGTS